MFDRLEEAYRNMNIADNQRAEIITKIVDEITRTFTSHMKDEYTVFDGYLAAATFFVRVISATGMTKEQMLEGISDMWDISEFVQMKYQGCVKQ